MMSYTQYVFHRKYHNDSTSCAESLIIIISITCSQASLRHMEAARQESEHTDLQTLSYDTTHRSVSSMPRKMNAWSLIFVWYALLRGVAGKVIVYFL